jgi:hypothetical protein
MAHRHSAVLCHPSEEKMPMQRQQLYLVIGALAVVVVGLVGYLVYEQSRPSGVEIRMDETGISVEQN